MAPYTRSRVAWERAHRLTPSHYPPIDLYDDISEPEDWQTLTMAVQRSNPRIREAVGDLSLVPVERRLAGPGANWVMAVFTHISPDRKTRFSDGRHGVYYAGDCLETVMHEHAFHMGRFFAASHEPEGWLLETREIICSIDAPLVDLRNGAPRELLDPDPERYEAPQAFARAARDAGEDGIVYPSLRRPGGECIGVFWPDVVFGPRQGDHFIYHWNGTVIDLVRGVTGAREIYRLQTDVRSATAD